MITERRAIDRLVFELTPRLDRPPFVGPINTVFNPLRRTLALRVRDRLLARWRVSEASFPALRTLIDSQMDLSLERLLASD